MKIKIKFYAPWLLDKEGIDELKYYTKEHNNKWNNIELTEDIKDADYLVVLDGIRKKGIKSFIKQGEKLQQLKNIIETCKYKRHPKKIFLQTEPAEIEILAKKSNLSNVVFNGTYKNHYHVSMWWIRKTFKEVEALPIPEFKKSLSVIVSNKTCTIGHRKRLEVIKKVSSLCKDMDVFGRDLESLAFDNYRGSLNGGGGDKFLGLYGYKYSIAFENSSHENYFTEKIVDCFLSWTKPIYWGCKNIDKYFPRDSYSYIDIFDKNAPEKILEEIKKPVDYGAIREARNLVLYKYNIWPSLEKIINNL